MLAAGALGPSLAGGWRTGSAGSPVTRASFAVTRLALAAIGLTGLPRVFADIALTRFALNQ